jgi:hypothetical protein
VVAEVSAAEKAGVTSVIDRGWPVCAKVLLLKPLYLCASNHLLCVSWCPVRLAGLFILDRQRQVRLVGRLLLYVLACPCSFQNVVKKPALLSQPALQAAIDNIVAVRDSQSRPWATQPVLPHPVLSTNAHAQLSCMH